MAVDADIGGARAKWDTIQRRMGFDTVPTGKPVEKGDGGLHVAKDAIEPGRVFAAPRIGINSAQDQHHDDGKGPGGPVFRRGGDDHVIWAEREMVQTRLSVSGPL